MLMYPQLRTHTTTYAVQRKEICIALKTGTQQRKILDETIVVPLAPRIASTSGRVEDRGHERHTSLPPVAAPKQNEPVHQGLMWSKAVQLTMQEFQPVNEGRSVSGGIHTVSMCHIRNSKGVYSALVEARGRAISRGDRSCSLMGRC